MNPSVRVALISWAKSRAVIVSSRIAASIPVDHILGGASRDELAALVVVLAEAVDPVRLRAVVSAQDIMVGPDTDRWVVLKAAHAEQRRLRNHGQPVPARIAELEREYERERQQRRKAAQPKPAGVLARIRQDEQAARADRAA